MFLEQFMPAFAPAALNRGAEYARSDRVQFTKLLSNGFIAEVQGARVYQVEVHLQPKKGGVRWSCTCPYFSESGPCKHIWASLVASQDFLGLPAAAAGKARLAAINHRQPKPDRHLHLAPDDDITTGDSDGEDWEDEDDDWEEWADDEALDFDHRENSPGGWRPGLMPGYAQPDWRSTLHSLQKYSVPRISRPPMSPDTVIHYIIDKDMTLRLGDIALHLLTRRPRKGGTGWTLYRPISLNAALVATLPDPTDRLALATLAGATTPATHRGLLPQTAFISAALADTLLPLLIATGRLGLATTTGLAGEDPPIMLTEGSPEPWNFELEVTTDPAQTQHRITGILRRANETIPLSAPQLLLSCGWFIHENELGRLTHDGNFAWISVLRALGEILVPIAETGEWMQTMLECRRPLTHFPEALQCPEEQGRPVPKLSLHPARTGYGDNYMGLIVHFRYDTRDVPASDLRTSIFDPENHRILARDIDAEAHCMQTLFGAGARLPRDAAHWAYKDTVDAELRVNSIPSTVRKLIAEGWEIDAEGIPYRRSGTININVTSGTDWFDIGGFADFDGQQVPMPRLLQALRKGEHMLRLGDGSIGILPEAWMQQLGLLAGAASLDAQNARFGRTQAFLLDALLAQQPGATWDETFTRIRKELQHFEGATPQDPPPSFQGTLRDYQRDGLGWFSLLQRFGFGGCLADDMGLGKTIQALALLLQRQRDGAGPSLVIVPRSVVVNWLKEAERFAPELATITHTEADRAKRLEALPTRGIIITTYAILRLDIDLLRNFMFDYVILDEAQMIKNAGTATAKAARLLQARHRLAMSGTPIENHLGELWSLFEFLNPGMLGASRAFDAALKQDGLNLDTATRDLLVRAIKPFILRRTKEQVARELPEKQEETIFCTLTDTQRALYDELRDYYRGQLSGKINADGLNKSKIMVLEALLRLRQAACHPGLVDETRSRQSSAKLELLLEQIEDIRAEGHKVLVFSQFVKMLAIVRNRLTSRNITFEYLDGSTHDRAARVERFQTDPACPVFLISLKAGGVGLNLTAADYVILLDPWWNPAVESQAIDRSHRIGQTRNVMAYRLVAKDTVEERILELQDKKRALADSIIKADTNILRSLTREDLERLLS